MLGKVEMQSLDDIRPMPGKRTSISLSEETRDRLANFGKAGESLETALIRALDLADECKAMKEKRKN
ncbi:MAG: hypothetical protein WB392_01160 [Methanotrichaceae archaeon]